MAARRTLRSRNVGRMITYGYGVAALVLLTVLALRVDAVRGWLWGAVAILVSLAVSLRSALVYAYRRHPSKLSWWIRPTPVVEREFTVTWLIYAVLFGAASVLVVLL